MMRLLAALVSGVSVPWPVLAACTQPWPQVRNPVEAAHLVETWAVEETAAGRLLELAGLRQGVAARLLELRYAIGKTTSTASGDSSLDDRIADLRGQVDSAEQRLAFIDSEIAQWLSDHCGIVTE